MTEHDTDHPCPACDAVVDATVAYDEAACPACGTHIDILTRLADPDHALDQDALVREYDGGPWVIGGEWQEKYRDAVRALPDPAVEEGAR